MRKGRDEGRDEVTCGLPKLICVLSFFFLPSLSSSFPLVPSSLPPALLAFCFSPRRFSRRGQVSLWRGQAKRREAKRREESPCPSLPTFLGVRMCCGCVFVVTLPCLACASYPHRTTSLPPVRNCPRGVGNQGARGTAGVGVRGGASRCDAPIANCWLGR